MLDRLACSTTASARHWVVCASTPRSTTRWTASAATSSRSALCTSGRPPSQRQALIRRAAELEHDNDDKIAGLAEAHASAAQERARLDRVAANSPEEADILNAARSQILRTAIEQRIGAALPHKALTLYDRVKAALSPADRRALALPLGVATDEATTDAWLAREAGKDGAPLVDRVGLDDALSDQQRLICAPRSAPASWPRRAIASPL